MVHGAKSRIHGRYDVEKKKQSMQNPNKIRTKSELILNNRKVERRNDDRNSMGISVENNVHVQR